MKNGFPCITFFILFITILPYFALITPAIAATDEDMQTLEMFFDEKEITSVATRAPQDVSQVAENLTIVTAREIEAINAHTLADVLRIVPGMQINIRGGPGSIVDASINGALSMQFLVVIDGVQQNNLSDNSLNLGAIPVQQIKRIEIIKGPASTSWGPAMGGVVNIVTKDPDEDANISGTVSSSLGENGTGDYRVQLSGTVGSLGYYLYLGKLTSSGLLPHNGNDENNIYSKLTWDLNGKGAILFTLGYNRSFIEMGEIVFDDPSTPEIEVDTPEITVDDLFSTLSLRYFLGPSLDLEISGRMRTQDAFFVQVASTGSGKRTGKEEVYGASAKVVWRQRLHTLVAGADFDHGKADAEIPASLSGTIDKWGIFINDTLKMGNFSLSPGMRYDKTNYKGDFTSASMGITWQLTEHTLLRGYAGKGYSIPSAIFNTAKEHVMAYQAGFETSEIPYLLLKTTFFHNRTSDAVSFPTEAIEKQVKQGVEVEVRTVPFFNTSLFAGFNFVDARSRESGAEIPGIARNTWNLGLYYDDRRSFHGALTGHYIRWKTSQELNILPARGKSFIWDINLGKRVFTGDDYSAELFFTGHNIFNGSQYQDGAFPNTRRWFEGGIRVRF